MKSIARHMLIVILPALFWSSCSPDKYSGFTGNITLKGSAYIVDTNSNASPIPLAGQPIYLGTGSDTSTYLYQCKTDSAGEFSISSLTNKSSYTLFTHFVIDGTEYTGSQSFKLDNPPNNVKTITLNVEPIYQNGMSILFTDVYGGAIANLPFRLYTSRLVALVDSTKYAFVNTTADINGRFAKYNIPTGWYYVVSRDTLGGTPMAIFDSLDVSGSKVAPLTAILH
jgi:hypothetical protein